MSTALAYAYRYPYESQLVDSESGAQLQLATCGGAEPNPFFFEGRFERPRRAADMLLCLYQVVQSRFYIPPAMLARILREADPVVTNDGERLRLEAFSSCCSTYARVDFLPEALDGQRHQRGTTNVDFNPPMRAAIARIRDDDRVALRVGANAVELERSGQTTVERKVKLPVRWLKGFVEVQEYQARMDQRLEISGVELRRFLQGVPKSTPGRMVAWAIPSGPGLRLSQREAPEGVRIGGLERLRILEPLARHAKSLRVYAAKDDDVSDWEVVLDEARFHLIMTPDVSRGFSGEGQALRRLADNASRELLPRVQASLNWQGRIDPAEMAGNLGVDAKDVGAALTVLGSRGLVGYDTDASAFFHRVLPFDMSLIEGLQPRLKNARKVIENSGVRIVRRQPVEAYVQGTGVEHRVREDGGQMRCTCPWFSKHQGKRGPCKHILAVQIALDAPKG
jgi:hypothetical protein